ncbi:protein ACCELERATED CELL DEATH 6-like, partial [Hibiscus syriacus]|uniref:protein ACCELERATED CELL DEATH 6-like n=1 Tax=Hibiscus syriacus TaxID=106335 RepID=UPI0019246F96
MVLFGNSLRQRKKAANQISTEFVQQILDKCPSLLKKPNAKGEIPLHVAARFGHGNIVQLLIETAKAEEKGLENGIDPEKQMTLNPHLASIVTKTPLYIAARRGNHKLVALVLDKSDAAVHIHRGPCGRTALHAAAMALKNEWISRTTRVILRKGKNLVKSRDENGRTPLHYAAHLGCTRMVELLLECDESAACEIDEDEMTALHMAARKGHLQVMWKIISYCPECCEIVDKRGWNFLHFAVVSLPRVTLPRFLRADRFRRFLHEKDIRGNTPLQVLAASRQFNSKMALIFNDDRETVRSENLDSKKKEHILELLKEVGHGEVAGSSVHPVRQNKFDDESTVKAREVHAVVSALVATTAFAAAFALPGGYKSDKGDHDRGSATLSHERAFVAFVIADSVAMISALSSAVVL